MSDIIKKEVIGKIIPSPKGDWNEKDTYDRMDFAVRNMKTKDLTCSSPSG